MPLTRLDCILKARRLSLSHVQAVVLVFSEPTHDPLKWSVLKPPTRGGGGYRQATRHNVDLLLATFSVHQQPRWIEVSTGAASMHRWQAALRCMLAAACVALCGLPLKR